MAGTQTNKKNFLTTYQLTLIAILSAIATILYLPPFQIPIAAFYKLDFSNLAVLLGGFAMGPLEAVMILLVKAILGMIWSTSAGVGELADFIMGAALVLPAVMLYHRKKSRKNALIGLIAGTITMIVVSVFVNKWILIPFYMGAFHMDMNAILRMAKNEAIDSEWKLLLLVTAPFNLLKGVAISLVTFFIYKPLSPILKGTFKSNHPTKR